MNARIRWAALGMMLCAVCVAGIKLTPVKRDKTKEPGGLPKAVAEAQPLAAPQPRRLPPSRARHREASIPFDVSSSDQPAVRTASHLMPALIAVTAAMGAAGADFQGLSVAAVGSVDPAAKTLNEDSVVRLRAAVVAVSGKCNGLKPAESETVALFVNGDRFAVSDKETFSFPNVSLPSGESTISFAVQKKETIADDGRSKVYKVAVRVGPVRVDDIDDGELMNDKGPYRLRVRFNTDELNEGTIAGPPNCKFSLKAIGSDGSATTDAKEYVQGNPVRDPGSNTVVLSVKDEITPGLYRLTITGGGSGIQDLYGNLLDGNDPSPSNRANFIRDILKPVAGQTLSVRPGLSGSTGVYVPFTEFTRPRTVPDGFNPSDKVETRVARLYYYRDAHRVAQIINRKVKSYNRAAVDVQRQLADKARTEADDRTAARQHGEREAVIKAQRSREKERELQAAEQTLNTALQELTNARRQGAVAAPGTDNSNVVNQLESVVRSATTRVENTRGQVQQLRDAEVEANEQVQQLDSQEKLAREEQFRREVAAAHADPDTYAPGVPGSADPVEQVSVSVIGEGLIQLRGPLKGINQIRTMIDQIDTPVGQVRVSVHSVQINGEKADRMEVVAKQIQTYIDHARFLTMQSSEMLRKAVVQVASRKAEEARGLFPGETQEDRDQRYLYAFFGKDFIEELRAMDSEFLSSGNKILSLHSMDTTSLSSALNLLALAKNSTRLEILQEFDNMLQGQLPLAEANYLEAGMTCKTKHFPLACRDPKFCPMAQNAKFESLRGFFDVQLEHDETMTPLQREFLRLAQIFKSRLVTEIEYKQRVMERAVIEDRLGNRLKELQDARDLEEKAQVALQQAMNALVTQRSALVTSINVIRSEVIASIASVRKDIGREAESNQELYGQLIDKKDFRAKPNSLVALDNITVGLKESGNYLIIRNVSDNSNGPAAVAAVQKKWKQALDTASRAHEVLKSIRSVYGLNVFSERDQARFNGLPRRFSYLPNDPVVVDATGQKAVETLNLKYLFLLYNELWDMLEAAPETLPEPLEAGLNECISEVSRRNTQDLGKTFSRWLGLRDDLFSVIDAFVPDAARRNELKALIETANDGFRNILKQEVNRQFASDTAQASRRPLDHKKFLDMLVDELEEKYIELLDGTRAHTANVDNYLKRLTTALDDDFNTQFYYPTFRYVREASQFYDVQFGQTETTSILANNRDFAKVDPSATMEFDLPKRDILLTEGINGAKAMMNDIGALANDPTFLAMAKMQSGGSTASPPAGATGGFGVVRDVLPGLSSSTAEQVMSQNANGGNQFGSNLENLIPDPAIYKFETGTGFEIRPVIQPDGQAVVFDFNYMYSTNIREPVRADEKHLGRIKRHYIDTDVQLSNFELREVSRYTVALKASRTSRGVAGLEDVPLVGVLFRPLPSDEASLQQNLIMAQATIFPTLFDLMGLRWAPAVADLDPLRVSNTEFVVRNRNRVLKNRVYDESSSYVDEFLRIPDAERRMDLYRSQESVPAMHPNGYQGPGLNLHDSELQEGYQPNRARPQEKFYPGASREGAVFDPGRGYGVPPGTHIENYPLESVAPGNPYPEPIIQPASPIRNP